MENENLTRTAQRVAAQQAPEDPNRTKEIEREKQKQKEAAPPKKEPPPPEPKRRANI